jgi:peroxiredoxin
VRFVAIAGDIMLACPLVLSEIACMPALDASGAKESTQKPPADSPVKTAILLVISGVALAVAAYFIYHQIFPPNPWEGEISEEQRESNYGEVTADQLLDLPLTDAAGQAVSLRERAARKHLVIVVTRGSLASVAARDKGVIRQEYPHVCPYCSSQTSGIVSMLDQFAEQDAEALIVFPVTQPSEQADAADLLKSAAVTTDSLPPPLVFDLNLRAVEKLHLKAHLARPASFIVDRAGKLRFAYVASNSTADRPSAGELLRHVTLIQAESKPVEKPAEQASEQAAETPVPNP